MYSSNKAMFVLLNLIFGETCGKQNIFVLAEYVASCSVFRELSAVIFLAVAINCRIQLNPLQPLFW